MEGKPASQRKNSAELPPTQDLVQHAALIQQGLA
jgi:hypothetical protein